MRKILFILLLSFYFVSSQAQKPFEGYLYNDEYKIYLQINLYDKDILVPGQEVFGNLDGYLGSKQCNQVWAITSSKVTSDKTATISLINNYGSEDLTATLTCDNDSSFTYRQTDGSTLKFPVHSKWQNIPKNLKFKKTAAKKK
jgi:hypothetical protein